MSTLDSLKSDIDQINGQINKEKSALSEMKLVAQRYSVLSKSDWKHPILTKAITQSQNPNYKGLYNAKYIEKYYANIKKVFARGYEILVGTYPVLGLGLKDGNAIPDDMNLFAKWTGKNWQPHNDLGIDAWHLGWFEIPEAVIKIKDLLKGTDGTIANIDMREKRIALLEEQLKAKQKELSDSYINIGKENIQKLTESQAEATSSITSKANTNSIIVVVVALSVIFVFYKIIF